MKNLKLLMASLVVSCFFITTNVNAQGNSSQVDFGDFSFYCPCAEEFLTLPLIWHEVMNNNLYHSNMKVEAVGETTGDKYVFKEIFKEKFNGNVMRVFNITKKGKKIRTDYWMFKDGFWIQLKYYCASGLI